MAVEGARVAGAGTADAGLAGMGQRVFELLLAANKPDVVTVTYMVSQGVRADDVPLSLPRPHVPEAVVNVSGMNGLQYLVYSNNLGMLRLILRLEAEKPPETKWMTNEILDSLREYAARLLADPRSALARIAQQGGISSEDVLGNITDVLSEADRRLKGEDVSDDAPVDEVTSQEDADAFVEAAARGDLSALRGLVRRNLRGAAKVYDPNMADSGGRIALLEALRGGHHDVVEWLLSQKTTALPVDVNVVEAGGQHRSSLMLAFDQDGFDVGGGMVRLLLSHGADPSAADASGRTLAAVVRGNLTQEYFVELATDLAAAGASAEAPGLVPLYFSCVGVNAAKATLAWKIHELQLAGSSPRSKPLVLALVGPAAHGRATLAVAAAQALGVGEDSTFRISLAVARTSTDLLGVVGGRPSSFAMFLTRHTRRRFVLLLDNFDSFAVPDMAVWRYLFARGSLVVEGNVLDLSRGVIFVKTSWGESAVANYSMGPATVSELIRGLSLGGAAALQGAFGPFARSAMQRAMPAEARPVADEDSIDVIVPFIEFNANEAMVIVDQYLRSQVCEPLARPREMPVRVDDTERADAKNRVVGDVLVHTHSSVRELVFDAWASGKSDGVWGIMNAVNSFVVTAIDDAWMQGKLDPGASVAMRVEDVGDTAGVVFEPWAPKGEGGSRAAGSPATAAGAGAGTDTDVVYADEYVEAPLVPPAGVA